MKTGGLDGDFGYDGGGGDGDGGGGGPEPPRPSPTATTSVFANHLGPVTSSNFLDFNSGDSERGSSAARILYSNGSAERTDLFRSHGWSKLVLTSMSRPDQPTLWQLWVHQPQRLWLRRALFQAHLWSGIALGLYILMISLTGSVLVYSNEIFRAATPTPIVSTQSGPLLTDAQLKDAAARQYPGYSVQTMFRPTNPNQAVEIWLGQNSRLKKRLFDPRSGRDVGSPVTLGIRFVSRMLDLHDNLLAGPEGRRVNGFGALILALVAVTGLAIWWPGIKTWRRSLKVPGELRPGRQRWARAVWHLHSMIGIWTIVFVLVFAASGFYLGNPDPFERLADWLQPPTDANSGIRTVDRVIYWLAYLHFGRINGIGIPCKGPGLCDQTVKAVWAIFGLAPAAMFLTGAVMWWNRVLRPRISRSQIPRQPAL